MYYTEEDITPAVNASIVLFGNVGRIIMGNDVIYNASIATREFGRIWYGDISMKDYVNKLTTLSERLRTPVYLFSASSEFSFNDAEVFGNSAIIGNS